MGSKNIVVAVDGSAASNAAVLWAANTAVKRRQPVQLVTAYTMPQFLYADGMAPPREVYEELEAEAREKIDDARQAVMGFCSDIQVSHTIREASPIDFLLELSDTAEMIVMGSRGLGGLSGLVVGSVSSAVVSHACCPVVVVRKDSDVDDRTKYGPVVVGLDGSGVSHAAVRVAFQEASARGGLLRVVHAWTDGQLPSAYVRSRRRDVGVLDVDGQWDEVFSQRQAMVASQVEELLVEFPDVAVEQIVERERPVVCLAEAARDAQLLVVGSHGRGGFTGMLLGSTSRALLHAAPCPLMVVRNNDKK